jgi:hypothetical protein
MKRFPYPGKSETYKASTAPKRPQTNGENPAKVGVSLCLSLALQALAAYLLAGDTRSRLGAEAVRFQVVRFRGVDRDDGIAAFVTTPSEIPFCIFLKLPPSFVGRTRRADPYPLPHRAIISRAISLRKGSSPFQANQPGLFDVNGSNKNRRFMNYQQLIPNVGTSAAPSWTKHDDKQIWMAWKGQGSDPGIYFAASTSLQPQPNPTTGQYSFGPQQQVPNVGTSASPAIASLEGTLYLFWRGEIDSTIYWAKSSDGKNWIDVKPLEMGDSLGANDHKAATSHAPTVVSGNDSLYLFWKGADADTRIWSSTFKGGPWLPQWQVSPTSGGVPGTSDSVGAALDGTPIHLTWKDEKSGDVWWCTLKGQEPSSQQQRIFGGASTAPAMVTDGNGVVWLAWNAPSSLSDIAGDLCFASLGSGGHRRAQAVRSGLASGFRPALVSTGSDSMDIMVAWKNLGNGPGIYYGPLIPAAYPAPSAGVARNNYLITNYNLNDPLQNMTVTVVAKHDLVNTATYNAVGYEPVGSPVTTGFSFQLNCQPPGTIAGTGPYPPAGQAVWEQFGTTVQGQKVFVWFDNSPVAGVPSETRSPQPLFLLPSANTIPKSYKIEIKLVTDASANNVTEVSVNAWDSNGNPIKGGTGSSPVDGPWLWPVTHFLAPILNLQFNIGGPGDGQYAKFQSDSILTVSYKADSPLMVRGATNAETAENANLSFGLLAAYPSNPIVQACSGS